MLRSALATVQNQSFRDFECFVVDDGSTDGTDAVLGEFGGDPRLIPLRPGRNQGMNASRNLALAKATGRFVTFLDSDDLWLPERLQAFHERIGRSPDAGFVFSNAYVLRWGRIIGTLFSPGRDIPEGKVPGYYAIGDRYLPYVTTNVAIRKDAFDTHGVFKTEMRTLDTELFARFLAAGLAVAAIKRPLSIRRLHEDQLTGRYRENFEESMIALASSGATPEEAADVRGSVAADVALYLVKAGRKTEAREFLEETLSGAGRSTAAWRLSLLPDWTLSVLRAVRTAAMSLRYSALAPSEYGRALSSVQSLLDAEQAPRAGR
ncbi:MAG: glycosyltransferase family 2 protein [Elusimicrobia bacterium]|nr:glycosyltransferase family 2 protein [Elusimicrobiota bacterium]